MRRNIQFGALVMAALIGSAHASTNIPETTAGNLVIDLGGNPSADNVYSVLHTKNGSFSDTFAFSISSTSAATAAYGTLALPSLYGVTANSFNLYEANGTLVSTGTITTSSLNTSAGLISASGLGSGSYYYQIQGVATGSNGGAYQFSQITAPVPEPSTYALTLMGLCVVGYAVFRQRHLIPQATSALAA